MQTQYVLLVLHQKRYVRETPLWSLLNTAHREKNSVYVREHAISMRYDIDRVFSSVQFTTQSFCEIITVVVGKFKSFVNIESCVTCFLCNKRNSWLAICWT